MLRRTVGFLLATTLIAFLTNPALAGDEERSSSRPLESIRHDYAGP